MCVLVQCALLTMDTADVCVCHLSLTHSDSTLSSQCVGTFCVILTTKSDHRPYQNKPFVMCNVEALFIVR